MQIFSVPKHELQLDWLQKRGTSGRWPRVVVASATVLVLVLVATYLLEQQNQALRDEVSVLQRELDKRASRTGAASPEELAKRGRTAQLIAQHNEVAATLEAVERVAPDGVEIESLSINPENKTYRIELRTSDIEAVTRYVENLNRGDSLRRWHVISIETQKSAFSVTLEAR